MPELEAMNTVMARMEVSNAGPTHDRRFSANLGYRVWNPFEMELQGVIAGGYDQVAPSFTAVAQIVE
ncbi:hypothetical protein [Granulicella sp. S190]|uniref:hypothetical protein n=1 Tax=Granulicella sp. S190 TaxID=1747226 RepID=UPI0015774422|nr:hypothetical protein [Granulicella sp. S190]